MAHIHELLLNFHHVLNMLRPAAAQARVAALLRTQIADVERYITDTDDSTREVCRARAVARPRCGAFMPC